MDMSFSADEIAGMLEEYEKDHATGMDPAEMAGLIYEHTSGYPFLVSKLCKLMDEEVAGSERFPGAEDAWTCAGFLEAERMLLGEKNTLFESMVNKLYDFPELKDIVYSILFTGKESSYNALNEAIGTAEMFGFVKNINGVVAIANRIFEMVFYNLFLTSAENQNTDIYKAAIQDKNQFVYAGHLNVERLLERLWCILMNCMEIVRIILKKRTEGVIFCCTSGRSSTVREIIMWNPEPETWNGRM